MVSYQEFLRLSQSRDSEERGRAAHLAALAYLGHSGPADEHAALYSALVSFLDDPSVRVRGALAYGLLHAIEAPRPILIALLNDSPVIARAVAQYSPALVDADLLPLIRRRDAALNLAICNRTHLTPRLAAELAADEDDAVISRILERTDVTLPPDLLDRLSERALEDAALRGLLLARSDLPGAVRLKLVTACVSALRGLRVVRGAVEPNRLGRLLRDALDTATTEIGDHQSAFGQDDYAQRLVERDVISSRVLLHALLQGHVLFFAQCIATLAETPKTKVFTLIDTGSRTALGALLGRAGLKSAVADIIVRLIFFARSLDLGDDIAARSFVVTALCEDLISEYHGQVPIELEDVFAYLSEQSVSLTRLAVRGVLPAYAETATQPLALPRTTSPLLLALSAA